MDEQTNSKQYSHWTNVAKKQKEIGQSLTHSDKFLPILERKAILANINKGDNVLEIGCGASDNAIYYMKACNKYFGVEVVDDFVELSNQKITDQEIKNATIVHSDGYSYICENEIDADILITQRFIINLKDRETQLSFFQKIKENSTNKNLKVVICEGFEDDLNRLNNLRKIAGLGKINVADYNNFFDKDFIEDVLKLGFKKLDEKNFNTYFFISRTMTNENFIKEDVNIQEFAFAMEDQEKITINEKISYSKVVVLTLS